jgi:hypothetical protein
MGKFDRNPGCRRCSLARRRDPVHPQPANGAKISPQKQVFDRPQPLSCGHVAPVCRESLPYAGYGRSGARPIRGSRSPESLSEFSVPLLPNTQAIRTMSTTVPLGTRRQWFAELHRNRSNTLDAPGWMWRSVVELIAVTKPISRTWSAVC